MDIGLGGDMDGYEVTHYIRTKPSTTRQIPIVALTAHGGDESKQRCIEAGIDAVLIKPLTQVHAADILKSFIPARHETATAKSATARTDLPDSDDEMFQLTQFPTLNSEEALKNCGTHEMLTELLTLMTQELPADLTRMKYACQYVERYWKSGQRDLFDALYHQAVSTIEETLTYIEGWLHAP